MYREDKVSFWQVKLSRVQIELLNNDYVMHPENDITTLYRIEVAKVCDAKIIYVHQFFYLSKKITASVKSNTECINMS